MDKTTDKPCRKPYCNFRIHIDESTGKIIVPLTNLAPDDEDYPCEYCDENPQNDFFKNDDESFHDYIG